MRNISHNVLIYMVKTVPVCLTHLLLFLSNSELSSPLVRYNCKQLVAIWEGGGIGKSGEISSNTDNQAEEHRAHSAWAHTAEQKTGSMCTNCSSK